MKVSTFGRLSLRARVTIWYACVLAVVLGAFAAAIVWQQGRIGMRRVDRELDAFAGTLENVLRDEVSESADPIAAAGEARATLEAPGHAIAILDGDGRALAGSAQPPAGAWRIHTRPMTAGGHAFVLRVGAPLDEVLRERQQVLEAVWIGVPVVLLLAVGGGLWLATAGPLVTRLRETLQAQRQFMADASHELRTPLSVIHAVADVTLARDDREAAEYREAVAIVRVEARRLSRLVDDMLVLARADADGYPLRPVNLYLNDLIAECQRAVEVLARERDVAVRPTTSADVPFRGDEDLLRRMLLNLLQNAVDHTRPGGAVTVDVSPNGRHVHIRIRDEGEGIPDADRERIFDRFVQLDAARRGAGAGLGLPIARWIAEAHGGTLELEDTRRTGSTFGVTLPLDAERAPRGAGGG